MPSPDLFTSIINQYLPEPHASLLNGILFGISLQTTRELYEQMKVVGLLHIVVLSGMNITILASIIGLFTKNLPKFFSVFIVIVSIVLFILFVGPKPPIIRAGLMGILSLLAIILGRKTIPLYILFVSFFITLLFVPDWISSISFQLSYAATLGLILFANSKPGNGLLNRTIGPELRLSLSAQAFTAPLIFIYFRQISIISPLANILVAWIIAPIMIFGFLACILGSINFFLGIVPAYITYGLLSYMLSVIEILALIPFASISF